LSPKLKPALTALAAVPILLLGTYDPHPVFPVLGAFRLTILYPALVLFAIAVPANAVNMLDVLNGSMSGTLTIISFTLAVVLAFSEKMTATGLALALFGSLLAFYVFNRYPARVFGGDAGSLAAGAAVGALAVIGRIELVAIVALTPYIMNAFYGLASIGRLYERREIKPRPVRLRGNGLLEATTDRHAPVTLTRLILAEGPMSEQRIVRIMQLLTALSSVLAVLAFLLIGVR
jgi:UDP-N-acetylglucosamine--dolichyl-phosphate N-acetylglucosaminephosphotransferase